MTFYSNLVGCVMADLPTSVSSDFQKLIIPSDISEFTGLETSPHVTIKFGVRMDVVDPFELKKYFENQNCFHILLTGLGIFENEECDVLYYKCTSPDLVYYKTVLEREFDCCEEKYPEYTPHCKIAYLKKGFGKKYLEYSVKPFPSKVDTITLSYGEPENKIRLKFKLL